eukprot:889447-Lingulodinium_polyedra.AAC.1
MATARTPHARNANAQMPKLHMRLDPNMATARTQRKHAAHAGTYTTAPAHASCWQHLSDRT